MERRTYSTATTAPHFLPPQSRCVFAQQELLRSWTARDVVQIYFVAVLVLVDPEFAGRQMGVKRNQHRSRGRMDKLSVSSHGSRMYRSLLRPAPPRPYGSLTHGTIYCIHQALLVRSMVDSTTGSEVPPTSIPTGSHHSYGAVYALRLAGASQDRRVRSTCPALFLPFASCVILMFLSSV